MWAPSATQLGHHDGAATINACHQRLLFPLHASCCALASAFASWTFLRIFIGKVMLRFQPKSQDSRPNTPRPAMLGRHKKDLWWTCSRLGPCRMQSTCAGVTRGSTCTWTRQRSSCKLLQPPRVTCPMRRIRFAVWRGVWCLEGLGSVSNAVCVASSFGSVSCTERPRIYVAEVLRGNLISYDPRISSRNPSLAELIALCLRG